MEIAEKGVHLEDLDLEVMITIHWIFKNYDG
jgi:hypothetical protein